MIACILFLSHGRRDIYQLKTQVDFLKGGASADETNMLKADTSKTPQKVSTGISVAC